MNQWSENLHLANDKVDRAADAAHSACYWLRSAGQSMAFITLFAAVPVAATWPARIYCRLLAANIADF